MPQPRSTTCSAAHKRVRGCSSPGKTATAAWLRWLLCAAAVTALQSCHPMEWRQSVWHICTMSICCCIACAQERPPCAQQAACICVLQGTAHDALSVRGCSCGPRLADGAMPPTVHPDAVRTKVAQTLICCVQSVWARSRTWARTRRRPRRSSASASASRGPSTGGSSGFNFPRLYVPLHHPLLWVDTFRPP